MKLFLEHQVPFLIPSYNLRHSRLGLNDLLTELLVKFHFNYECQIEAQVSLS